MSTYRKEGKDVIIFATADDHKEPSKVKLPEPDSEPPRGLILPNGEINWDCPCLGDLPKGPCAVEFKEAFLCFHKSTAEPKGSECLNAFKEMHLCMAEHPELYKPYVDDDDEDDLDDLNIELTDAEKALLSEENVKDKAEKKETIISKVEEKQRVHKDPKPSSKSSPTAGSLEFNA